MSIILKGLGGRFLVTKGYGGGTTRPVDHRTLYAQAATRKPTTAIDPTKTAATRK